MSYASLCSVRDLYVHLSCGFVSTSGLQVATDMQAEITARREQVDSLQGKIQHLEEAVEKLHQVHIIHLRLSCHE